MQLKRCSSLSNTTVITNRFKKLEAIKIFPMHKIIFSSFTSKIIVIQIGISLCLGCKVSVKTIVGNYRNQIGDTLSILKSNRYEYKQKLNSGEFGWNTGKVQLDGRKVTFTDTRPDPYVGFKMQVRTESEDAESPLALTVLINGSEKNVHIDDFKLFKNISLITEKSFKIDRNKLYIFDRGADSALLYVRFFSPIDFRIDRFKRNHSYTVNLIPAERLFDFDKYVYLVRNSKLKASNGKLTFKKIK